jgi:hypothetical protein
VDVDQALDAGGRMRIEHLRDVAGVRFVEVARVAQHRARGGVDRGVVQHRLQHFPADRQARLGVAVRGQPCDLLAARHREVDVGQRAAAEAQRHAQLHAGQARADRERSGRGRLRRRR